MSPAATSASPSSRRPRAAVAVAAALVVGVGCLAAVRDGAREPIFDHAAHLKRDLSCLDCHEGADKSARAAYPAPDMCANCHDPATDKAPVAAAVKTYVARYQAGAEKLHPPRATSGDVVFSHSRHAQAKVDCASCHEGATRGALADPKGPMTMDGCTSCHAERGVGARLAAGRRDECATCHTRISKDAAPKNHLADWTRFHGPVSRNANHGAMAERCDLCHARADCDACHAQEQPRDHTQSFRTVSHGLAAAMDRSRCLACHQADSCDRCHENTPPRSHRGSWGAPRERHCLFCHEPVAAEGCAICHRGTPSHALAAPKPADHTAAMNCRMCHGRGAPMPHVDNLSDCNRCHR